MIARLEQWLRWPLWSWRNLFVSTIAVLVVFTAVGRLTTSSGPAQQPRSAAATVQVAVPAPSTAAPTTQSTVPVAAPATVPATPGGKSSTIPVTSAPPAGQPSAPEIAVAFTTAWTRTTLDQPAWLAGLKPLATPEYLTALTTVDPARVPATRSLDSGRLLSTSGQQSLVRVATDAGSMTVTLVMIGGHWLVADIEPADQPPGASTPALTPTTGSPATAAG